MKAAATPAQATMTPPTAGPKLRAMLKLTLFNAIALGSSAGVTCSPTDACHEGPNRAIPLPTRQVNRRRLAGPTWPPKTAIEKRIEPTNAAINRDKVPSKGKSTVREEGEHKGKKR